MLIKFDSNLTRKVGQGRYEFVIGNQVFYGSKSYINEQVKAFLIECAFGPKVHLCTTGEEHTIIIEHGGQTDTHRGSGHGIVELRNTCHSATPASERDIENAALNLAIDLDVCPDWLSEGCKEDWHQRDHFNRIYREAIASGHTDVEAHDMACKKAILSYNRVEIVQG